MLRPRWAFWAFQSRWRFWQKFQNLWFWWTKALKLLVVDVFQGLLDGNQNFCIIWSLLQLNHHEVISNFISTGPSTYVEPQINHSKRFAFPIDKPNQMDEQAINNSLYLRMSFPSSLPHPPWCVYVIQLVAHAISFKWQNISILWRWLFLLIQ